MELEHSFNYLCIAIYIDAKIINIDFQNKCNENSKLSKVVQKLTTVSLKRCQKTIIKILKGYPSNKKNTLGSHRDTTI